LENPKKVSYQHYYLYTSDYARFIRRKLLNCRPAALAVCLLLFSASYYLHSRSTASEAQGLVATWAEFQHSVVYYATDQCRKRLGLRISAEGGQ